MNQNLKNIDLIIKNGIIVTLDKQNTITKNGAIAINKDKIVEIDSTEKITNKYQAKTTIDANDKIVMPGFVNSHTHLAMTVFRGIADDLTLSEWLQDYIFPAEGKYMKPKVIESGSKLAIIEMIHGGTTCFNDMYYYQDITASIASKMGIRGIVSEGLIDFPVPNNPTPEHGMKYTEMMIEKYKNDPLIDVGVGAHATYTCSPKMLQTVKKFADKHNVNFHIHVAESKWEMETIAKKYRKTPIHHLEDLGILDINVIAAHCVWLDDVDIKTMAKRKVGIAHNPSCNMKISSGAAPIPDFWKAGLNIGLATDGTASNNNLNMIQEMRMMALLHKLNTLDPTVANAEQVIRAATIDSARILNKDKEIGSLEVGKKADIILIETRLPNVIPIYNVYSAIVYSLLGNEVTDVIINGKIIMQNNKILNVDEKQIMKDVENIATKINNEIRES